MSLGFSMERPLPILSGSALAHALLVLGAQHVELQGVHLQACPSDGKLERRLKSPSVKPEYWHNPAF